MLPAVIFKNQVAIALLFEAGLDFLRNVWPRIHVIPDRAIFADKDLKLGFPTFHHGADFDEITQRHRLHERCIHNLWY